MLVNYHGQLWLIGGFLPVGHNLEAAASDHVLILDPAQNRWVEGPPLHHARAAGAAVVVGDQIVVVGGRTGGKTETEVKPTEIYNGKSWHDAPDIPVPGDHLAGVTDGTYLYAIGGRALSVSDNHNALQRFDPATGQWTQLTPLPVADSDLGAAYMGGQLITFGGENLFSVFRTARAYNLATKKWSTLQPSRSPARDGRGSARPDHLRHRRGGRARGRRIHQHHGEAPLSAVGEPCPTPTCWRLASRLDVLVRRRRDEGCCRTAGVRSERRERRPSGSATRPTGELVPEAGQPEPTGAVARYGTRSRRWSAW